MSLVLVLLAFVGWTGYRVVSLGGTCLALAGAGLVLQATVGWLPAEQARLLTYQFGVVAVAAVLAVSFGLRRRPDGFGGVAVPLGFSAASFAVSRFPGVDPLPRVVLGALAAVLLLIAVDILADLRMMRPYAPAQAYLPIRRLWRAATLTAFAGILGNAGSLLTPWLWPALGLLLLSFASLVVALHLAAFVVILVRNPRFAQDWARPWSRTRRAATADLVRWAATGAGALLLLAVPVAVPDVVRPPAWVTVALVVAGAACVVAGGATLRRLLDRAADHRYRIEPPGSPQVASALRGLVESEPVYRLLPGISRRW